MGYLRRGAGGRGKEDPLISKKIDTREHLIDHVSLKARPLDGSQTLVVFFN